MRLVGAKASDHANLMSEFARDQSGASGSNWTTRWGIILGLIILFGVSACCIFLMLFAVPKFEQIFADALPGRPLPLLTSFFISARMGLAFINLAWPILGTYLFVKKAPSTALWINLGIFWSFLQFGLTVFALFLPMASDGITGMSEAKP